MSASKALAALALAAALAVGGCQNPNGSTDWGSTLLLGAGVGVAAALVAGTVGHGGSRHYADAGRYGRPSYGSGGRHYAQSGYGFDRR